MANSIHRPPEVLWAQRSDRIYLTIALPDAKHVSVNSEPEGLFSFSAVGADGKPVKIDLKLYGSIISQGSKINVGLRNISCTIQKEKKGWWNRLLKSEERPPPYVKVDWNKWCDEDEEEDDILDSDDDYSGENEEEDDDEDSGLLYLPDLEKARGKLTD